MLSIPLHDHHAAAIKFPLYAVSFPSAHWRQDCRAYTCEEPVFAPFRPPPVVSYPPSASYPSTCACTRPMMLPLPPPTPATPPQFLVFSSAKFRPEVAQNNNQLFLLSANLLEAAVLPKTVPTDLIPAHCHKFLHLFRKSDAQGLLPHKPIAHTMSIFEGKQPPFRPLYVMASPELDTLRDYLKE